MTNLMLEVLNNGADIREINHTYLCLILKVKKPKHSQNFRPISLCNVIFKIITNTITNRIKLILPYIVGPYPIAFVPGRLITDNTFIAFEMFHNMRKKKTGNVGVAGLKLDIAKAYDKIEWAFLERVLRSMGFHNHWVCLIMKCISIVFKPERGLRQGDPLLPYLFILCVEVLFGLILKAQEDQALYRLRWQELARRFYNFSLQMMALCSLALPLKRQK